MQACCRIRESAVCVYVLLKQRKSTTNDMLVFMAVGQITRGPVVSQSETEGPRTRLTEVRGWEDVPVEARKQIHSFQCCLLSSCLG